MLAIIKNTNHRIKHTKKFNKKVEKYWLPAVRIQNPVGLRRWNYLPHPSSLTLWISWAENEGAEGRGGVLYLGRELAAPCRAAGPLPPSGGAAGTRQGPMRKKNYFFLHIGPYLRAVGV